MPSPQHRSEDIDKIIHRYKQLYPQQYIGTVTSLAGSHSHLPTLEAYSYKSWRLRPKQGSTYSVAVDDGSPDLRGTGMPTYHGARRMNPSYRQGLTE
jgi:hypothetical protein